MIDRTRLGRDEYAFRPAEPDDGLRVVSVFRAAMPEAVVAVNVLGTSKAARFVDHAIEASKAGGSDLYWVAEDAAGEAVAFAQLRLGRETTFINNLHVAPDHQGRGIGGRLMRLMTTALSSEAVAADVFEGSGVSRGMFERAGFELANTFHWHLQAPGPSEPGWYAVHDLPQADATQEAFDLSVFRVETSAGSHQVGRIGTKLYRLVGAAAVADPHLRAALHALDPNRSILMIVPADVDTATTEPHLVSRRLMASRVSVASRYGPWRE